MAAIPNGGIPVALAAACGIAAEVALVPVVKVRHALWPDVGLGALAVGGEQLWNRSRLNYLALTDDEVARSAAEALSRLRGLAAHPRLADLHATFHRASVVLMDDGMSSGYTALAGANLIGSFAPERLRIATPVAHRDAIALLERHGVDVMTLVVGNGPSFLVGDQYDDFSTISDAARDLIHGTEGES